MVIAVDVAKMHSIIKNTDVLHVDSVLTLKWDYSLVGDKKLEQEEDKALEEWDIWKISLDWLKMALELAQLPNPKREKLNDEYKTF
jgi:hypothetical protein